MAAVIFDLDGTLADTSGDLLAAANHCFRDMGLGDVLGPQDAGIALRGGRAMLRAGLTRVDQLDDAVVDRYYPILLDAYGAAISVHTYIYPGAMDAIKVLKSQGYGVGICTNKPAELADQLLRDLGVRDVFGSLVGADTLPVRKPDPAPLLEAARAAAVPSVLVTFGPAGDDMVALEPEALLDDYSALPAVTAALMPR